MASVVQVKDFPGYYVANNGVVYSLDYNKTGRIRSLRQSVSGNGYCRVALLRDGKRKDLFLHRIVAEAFIPNPENKSQVNHKNGDKKDNRVENLEWATPQENIRHSYDVLNRPISPHPTLGKFGKDNPLSKPVLQIKDGVVIAEFGGTTDAERKTGISHSHISQCCSGKQKTAGGYEWRYKMDEKKWTKNGRKF